MDAWFAVAVFLLGAACGALLTRITYKTWEHRTHHEASPEPSVALQDESPRPRTTELRACIFFGELSLTGSTWRKLTPQWLHSKNLGE